MKPLFSIIIPIYNVNRYLGLCLDSVLRQTYSHLEVILVDDGSMDGSAEICDNYAASNPHVRVYHRQNHGVSAARNFGVSKAQGEYILFLDADDYYINPLMLEKLEKQLQPYDMTVFGVVGCLDDQLMKSPLPHAGIDGLVSEYDSGKAFLEDLLRHNPGYMWWPWRYVFKRSVWQTNDIAFPLGVALGEDAATIYKAILAMGKVLVVQEPFYAYRQQREDSATNAVAYSKSIIGFRETVQAINYTTQLQGVSENLKTLLCNNFAMGYYAMLICSTLYPKDDRKKCWQELQRHMDIARYTATRKQKVAYQLIKYLGIPMTGRMLGIWRYLKHGK